MIKKVLIANRGEIACRVIQTAKKLGIKTAAVFSAADQNALHTQQADEAIFIGPAPSDKSYLRIDALIDVALKIGADAIHPGYGFLAENAEFAAACENAHLIFIGPPSIAITAMGNKSMAKKLMASVDVPLLPGYHGEDQSESALYAAAQAIGFPILLKAAAGGGGKGMKIVECAEDFSAQYALAKQEALNSFKDDTLLIEKYLAAPRHIEVQIFADRYGQCIHLFDRDCSTQRRHQKIIEEAPAPGLSEDLRERMYAAAIAAAQAVDYVGAGTIEFLVSNEEDFYFMEMNTRLQVEHPVTEMITGLDLVAWQFYVASGQPLPLTQEKIQRTGHAMEVRLCAENPQQDFLPATGLIQQAVFPCGENIRVDTGVRSGDAISVYYDSMIAKIATWAEDRNTAIQKLHRALQHTYLTGIKTNIAFLIHSLQQPTFLQANMHTQWLMQAYNNILENLQKAPSLTEQMAVVGLFQLLKPQQNIHHADAYSPWSQKTAWQLNQPAQAHYTFIWQQQKMHVDIYPESYVDNRNYRIQLNGDIFHYRAKLLPTAHSQTRFQLQLEHEGLQHHWIVIQQGDQLDCFLEGFHTQIHLYQAALQDTHEVVDASLSAPMPATLVKQLVSEGDLVEKGQILLTLEAMKMQHNILAPYAGEIVECFFAVGDTVEEGSLLIELQEIAK